MSSVTFASCYLDFNRWEYLTHNNEFTVFLDTQTIIYDNKSNFAQAWECHYYPNSCEIHRGEHYHYYLSYFNFNNNSAGLKSFMERDRFGYEIRSGTYPYVEYNTVYPGSIGETVFMAVRKKLLESKILTEKS